MEVEDLNIIRSSSRRIKNCSFKKTEYSFTELTQNLLNDGQFYDVTLYCPRGVGGGSTLNEDGGELDSNNRLLAPATSVIADGGGDEKKKWRNGDSTTRSTTSSLSASSGSMSSSSSKYMSVKAHRVILAAASPFLHRLLLSHSDTCSSSSSDAPVGTPCLELNEDYDYIDVGSSSRVDSGGEDFPTTHILTKKSSHDGKHHQGNRRCEVKSTLHRQQGDGNGNLSGEEERGVGSGSVRSNSSSMANSTIKSSCSSTNEQMYEDTCQVILLPEIHKEVLSAIVSFMYTGQLIIENDASLITEVRDVSRLLEIRGIECVLDQWFNHKLEQIDSCCIPQGQNRQLRSPTSAEDSVRHSTGENVEEGNNSSAAGPVKKDDLVEATRSRIENGGVVFNPNDNLVDVPNETNFETDFGDNHRLRLLVAAVKKRHEERRVLLNDVDSCSHVHNRTSAGLSVHEQQSRGEGCSEDLRKNSIHVLQSAAAYLKLLCSSTSGNNPAIQQIPVHATNPSVSLEDGPIATNTDINNGERHPSNTTSSSHHPRETGKMRRQRKRRRTGEVIIVAANESTNDRCFMESDGDGQHEESNHKRRGSSGSIFHSLAANKAINDRCNIMESDNDDTDSGETEGEEDQPMDLSSKSHSFRNLIGRRRYTSEGGLRMVTTGPSNIEPSTSRDISSSVFGRVSIPPRLHDVDSITTTTTVNNNGTSDQRIDEIAKKLMMNTNILQQQSSSSVMTIQSQPPLSVQQLHQLNMLSNLQHPDIPLGLSRIKHPTFGGSSNINTHESLTTTLPLPSQYNNNRAILSHRCSDLDASLLSISSSHGQQQSYRHQNDIPSQIMSTTQSLFQRVNLPEIPSCSPTLSQCTLTSPSPISQQHTPFARHMLLGGNASPTTLSVTSRESSLTCRRLLKGTNELRSGGVRGGGDGPQDATGGLTSDVMSSSGLVTTGAVSSVGTAAAPTWKSRQPRMCPYCERMFSNKFNLKQHILNMHTVGHEIKCELCDKTVKNKWYLRRHHVTHHGAPLKK